MLKKVKVNPTELQKDEEIIQVEKNGLVITTTKENFEEIQGILAQMAAYYVKNHKK